MNNAPIGIFDSGVGGLSVYLHLHKRLPNERFIYYADTANVPYGEKSSQEIINLSTEAVGWLVSQGAKLVVVACNSASAYALNDLRKDFNIPIVGLVPAIKPACQLTKTNKIAVLATQATLNGNLLQQVITDFATPNHIKVYKHFEPKLVPWVESGMPISHEVADLLIAQMYAWLAKGIDILVLGCTHYPFFRQFLQDEINNKNLTLSLVDSGAAIADRVSSLLTNNNLNCPNQTGDPSMSISGTHKSKTRHIAERLIGGHINLL